MRDTQENMRSEGGAGGDGGVGRGGVVVARLLPAPVLALVVQQPHHRTAHHGRVNVDKVLPVLRSQLQM